VRLFPGEDEQIFVAHFSVDPLLNRALLTDRELNREFKRLMIEATKFSERAREATAADVRRRLLEALERDPSLTQEQIAPLLLVREGPHTGRLVRYYLKKLGIDWKALKREVRRAA
jgi:hypothetical protein